MASCYCSPATVFVWMGAILILSAFVSLISWGAVTNWPLSLSAIFCILLFGMATDLQRRAAKRIPGALAEDGKDEDDEEDESGSDAVAGLRLLTSLLFLLGCFSVGVTGFFLPVNLIKCNKGDGTLPCYGGAGWSGQWVTDTTNFPQEVQAWVSGSKEAPYNEFAYIPSTSVALFSPDDVFTYTWKITADISTSEGPKKLSTTLLCPNSFVVLPTNDLACFVADCVPESNGVVACTDGTNINTIDAISPRGLIVDDIGTVWYKANPPFPNDEYNRDVVYSIANARESMVPIRRSVYTTDVYPSPASASPEAATECGRKIAATCLFVSAIPVLVLSIVLWVRQNVHSMPVSTYGGLSGIVVTLYYIFVDPLYLVSGDEAIFEVLKWWFAISPALWLFGLTLLFFTGSIHKHTMSWSFNFASLAYFIGSIILYEIFTEQADAWRWILITLATYFPLILWGLATNHFFGIWLGSLGLMLDVWRITALVSDSVNDGYSVPIWFVMMGGSGLALGALGSFLNRQQKRIQGALLVLGGKCLGWFVRPENDEGGGDEDSCRGPVVIPVTREEEGGGGDEGVQGTVETAVAVVA